MKPVIRIQEKNIILSRKIQKTWLAVYGVGGKKYRHTSK